MLLAVDVGNTQTVLGLFDGESWSSTGASRQRRSARATSSRRSSPTCSSCAAARSKTSRACLLSSTVPLLVRAYHDLAERHIEAPLLVLGPGTRTGIPILYDDPREVGPDRIANAVAARERYGAPCIVVDFGTSTNFDAVSAEGEYVGGVLAPGIEISMDALFARAARLDEGRTSWSRRR